MWTDKSYKSPLLASAVACIVGNLAYCLSYDTGSLTLLLIGRLVTGFGAHNMTCPFMCGCILSHDDPGIVSTHWQVAYQAGHGIICVRAGWALS